ncbi:MAG: hypothetical protein IT364_07250 [Candidatus Hydrogenedentes bacterium]|nr:hypothetical protein [Candidatus Hydrogenedentota bacterium]
MANRLAVILHDDWEIRGNGLGNVAHLQYIPALTLMGLAREAGIPLTFMVELGQQLAFQRFSDKDPNLGIQARLWEETVQLMWSNGCDVQPHIHPQWFGSSYVDGYIHMDGSLNIATYGDAARREMLSECFECLRAVLRGVDSTYRITSFKAGAHALQPSHGILNDLKEQGVGLVMGPRLGLKAINPAFSVDYRHMEESTLPYCPDFDDVTRIGPDRGIAILPMSYWDVDPVGKWHLIRRRLSPRRLACGHVDRLSYHRNVPRSILERNPRADYSEGPLTRKLLKPYRAGLNLSGPQSFAELKHILDRTVARLSRLDCETVPLVIESHSKDHEGNWDNLAAFLRYLADRYGDRAEFLTVSQFLANIRSNPGMIRQLAPGDVQRTQTDRAGAPLDRVFPALVHCRRWWHASHVTGRVHP